MKKAFSLVTLLCVAIMLHGAVVNYTADNTTVFPNPERGYTVQADEVVQFGEGKKAGNEACAPGERNIFDWDAGY